MDPKLSICIPVHNFGHWLPRTLDTIVCQKSFNDVELMVLDGASTDNTKNIIKSYQRYFSNIQYIRRDERGGIDRDMAYCLAFAKGDYCWLFSGDDLMLPGALERVLLQIRTGHDVYLTRHLEWVDDRQEWVLWPTVQAERKDIYDLSLIDERREYFSLAQNTEAFFSFIGGLVVSREKWLSIPLNEDFVGSCWAHAARLFELMPQGLSVKVLSEPYLHRRPDNDSFGSGSITARFRLTIDGYVKMADYFFGSNSYESLQIRRVLRNEYHPLNMWLGKFLCLIDPEREDIKLMDRLLETLYGDNSLASLRVRVNYRRVSLQRFRKWQPELSAKFEALKAVPRAPANV